MLQLGVLAIPGSIPLYLLQPPIRVVTHGRGACTLESVKLTERTRMPVEENTYKITVEGHLDQRWSSWLDGLTLTHFVSQDGKPQTMIVGIIADQAGLHGVLARVRDIRVTVVSVTRIESQRGGRK
jgi:hypothetical protein